MSEPANKPIQRIDKILTKPSSSRTRWVIVLVFFVLLIVNIFLQIAVLRRVNAIGETYPPVFEYDSYRASRNHGETHSLLGAIEEVKSLLGDEAIGWSHRVDVLEATSIDLLHKILLEQMYLYSFERHIYLIQIYTNKAAIFEALSAAERGEINKNFISITNGYVYEILEDYFELEFHQNAFGQNVSYEMEVEFKAEIYGIIQDRNELYQVDIESLNKEISILLEDYQNDVSYLQEDYSGYGTLKNSYCYLIQNSVYHSIRTPDLFDDIITEYSTRQGLD